MCSLGPEVRWSHVTYHGTHRGLEQKFHPCALSPMSFGWAVTYFDLNGPS